MAAVAVVSAAVGWALFGLPGAPADCPASGCDCEAPRAGLIRQPANAWSSLARAATGIALLSAEPAKARRRPAVRHAARAGRVTLPASALVLAGTAAFLFHAGLTAWAAHLDGLAVGVLVATVAGHGLATGARRRPLRPTMPRAAALLSWLLLGGGGLCWWLGRSGGPWCRPHSLLQAHAAWHLPAAAALGLWLAGSVSWGDHRGSLRAAPPEPEQGTSGRAGEA
ncbi:MAG: hypothetical protein FJW79_02630 [Actinobacteria bacterium]|nr:hypothetical protein [Actinomycetota bacterium]